MIIIFTIIAIFGGICVSFNKSLIANYIWSISNLFFIYHNLIINEYEMMSLFIVYEGISLFGIYNLQLRGNNK